MARPRGSKNRRVVVKPTQPTPSVQVIERPRPIVPIPEEKMAVSHEEAPLNYKEEAAQGRDPDYNYVDVEVDEELAKKGYNMKRKLMRDGWVVDIAETKELGTEGMFVMKKPKAQSQVEEKANFDEWHEQTHGPLNTDGRIYEIDESISDEDTETRRTSKVPVTHERLSLVPEK